MTEFTTSVRNWLESDPNNVIAVHCKGKNIINNNIIVIRQQ